MAKYSITIDEETNNSLLHLADAANVTVEDLIYDIIDYNFKDTMVTLAIMQYKKGNLKAREAWKLSGLNYKDFQTKALLSSIE